MLSQIIRVSGTATNAGPFHRQHCRGQELADTSTTPSFEPPLRSFHYLQLTLYDRRRIPQGVIGATAHITKDENGEDIMFGPDAIPGEEEDYRVSGPLYTHFDAFTS